MSAGSGIDVCCKATDSNRRLYSPANQGRVAVEAGAGEVIEDRVGCWNFRLVLDYEHRSWCAGDTRQQ